MRYILYTEGCKNCRGNKTKKYHYEHEYIPTEGSSDNSNCQFSDKERELLSIPFGKKTAKEFRSARDVDKREAAFHKKYAHLDKFAAGDRAPDEVIVNAPKNPEVRKLYERLGE